MNGKSTPGPWYYDRATHTIRAKSREAFVESRMMGDYMGCIVAGMDEATGGEIRARSVLGCEAERDANADFIIRAANSHYELLEALRPLAAWAENERRRHNASDEENEAAYMGELADKARAAIKKATGEE